MFRSVTPYLYLLLPALLIGIFFLYPLLMASHISLLDYSHDLYHPNFVGLGNYLSLLHMPAFWNAIINTVVLLIGIVPVMVTFPLLLSLLVNGEFPGVQTFRVLLYMPVIVSMVVAGLTWRWLLADDGLLNGLLAAFHLPKVAWLTDPDIVLYSIMLVIIWKGAAYYMMMYLAHLQNVSQDLYEAAILDGADNWKKHWHVTLPHLRPTMIMVAIISTIGTWKIFTEIYVMTRGGPAGGSKTLVYFLYERAFENLDLGIASAAGLILMGILIVFSIMEMVVSGKAESIAFKPKKTKLKVAHVAPLKDLAVSPD
jgi:putative chitobiose transport system permease protein